MASRDLVHWKHLPAAVMPDTEYDADGAFSGSATLLSDGTPVILYTGAHLPAARAFCGWGEGQGHGAVPGSHRALVEAGAAACAGVSNFSRLGYYYQQQAMLRPTNASDPELQMWCAAAPLPDTESCRTLCLQWAAAQP